MVTKVGINGFGRIGRQVFKAIAERYPNCLEVVAVNDLEPPSISTHLLKWDTTYGPWIGHQVTANADSFAVDGRTVKVFTERDPAKIQWDAVGAQIVIESTGRFTDANVARGHMNAPGVRKIIISAPAKNEDWTVVLGVNEDDYDPAKHNIISNASCTTNGLAPVAKVLHEAFGIERGMLTTIHAYTGTQSLVDTVKSDVRDARAAASNMIPSATGAAKAVGLVLPSLAGKFKGMAVRVPTPTVSLVDFTAILDREVSEDEIRMVMVSAAEGRMNGILAVTDEELVSSDFRGNTHSSIFSSVDTLVLGDMVKVAAWYDNEWGYACRVADLCDFMTIRGL